MGSGTICLSVRFFFLAYRHGPQQFFSGGNSPVHHLFVSGSYALRGSNALASMILPTRGTLRLHPLESMIGQHTELYLTFFSLLTSATTDALPVSFCQTSR